MNLKACLSVLLLSCALAVVPAGTVKAETMFDDGGSSYVSSSKTGIYVEPKIGFTVNWMKSKYEASVAGNSGSYGCGTKSSATFAAGVSVGYDWYPETSLPIRTELEYIYHTKAKAKSLDGDTVKSRNWTLLCNAYYDFRLPSYSLVPYAGLGVGIARSHADASGGGVTISGRKTAFAFQVGGGCLFPFTDRLSADLNLRYYRVCGNVKPSVSGVVPSGNQVVPVSAGYKLSNQNAFQVMGGLRFDF